MATPYHVYVFAKKMPLFAPFFPSIEKDFQDQVKKTEKRMTLQGFYSLQPAAGFSTNNAMCGHLGLSMESYSATTIIPGTTKRKVTLPREQKEWSTPGIEPGTSSTLKMNHTLHASQHSRSDFDRDSTILCAHQRNTNPRPSGPIELRQFNVDAERRIVAI